MSQGIEQVCQKKCMNFDYKYLKQVGILELQTINIVPVIGKQYRIKNLVPVKPEVVLNF